ncbi:MAG: hypothetical protein V7776_03315 [Halopseudomonas aestusnigri]
MHKLLLILTSIIILISQNAYPASIRANIDNFNGMPFDSIDAAYDDLNGGIVMFSGESYARYNLAQQKFIGGTANINNFTGMPFTRVDAAFIDNRGGIVMFSGNSYARYNLAQQKFIGGTANISNFTGMPFTSVDAAFNHRETSFVMFSGDSYARYNLAQQKFIGGTAKISNFTGMPFTKVDVAVRDRKTYNNTKIIMINESAYQLFDMQYARFDLACLKPYCYPKVEVEKGGIKTLGTTPVIDNIKYGFHCGKNHGTNDKTKILDLVDQACMEHDNNHGGSAPEKNVKRWCKAQQIFMRRLNKDLSEFTGEAGKARNRLKREYDKFSTFINVSCVSYKGVLETIKVYDGIVGIF